MLTCWVAPKRFAGISATCLPAIHKQHACKAWRGLQAWVRAHLYVVSHSWQTSKNTGPYLCSLSQRPEPSDCDWALHTVSNLQVISNEPIHNHIVKVIPTCINPSQ